MCRLRDFTPIIIDNRFAVINSLVHIFAVIAHMERKAIRDQAFFHKIKRKRIDHFTDDDFRLGTVVCTT